MTFYKATIAGLLALTLAGCVQPAPKTYALAAACPADSAMTQTTLYFGLSRPAGADITAKEWQTFIDSDVTPRFRDGLTVFDAKGQWLGNDGKLAREQSKALMLIHSTDKESESKIEALRGIYKSRFAQDSVMRVDQPVCVHF
ncbi:DUF3574 domain-containing protein [Dryocola sp. BD626]|uniref:DUF3574 domain-containing protein n=1 Tax=Dryocola sp. BD626 TaxID=3133273 RepID=UPI003F4FBE07